MWSFLPCFCVLISTALAGGGAGNLFLQEDLVLEMPLSAFVMVLFVICTTIFISKIFHTLVHLRNRHLAQVFATVFHEVTVLGIISLGLLFFTTVVHNPQYVLLFEWAHLVLFLMAMTYVCVLSLFILLVQRLWRSREETEKKFDNLVQITQALSRNSPAGIARTFFFKWMLYRYKKFYLRLSGDLPPIRVYTGRDPLAHFLEAAPVAVAQPRQRRKTLSHYGFGGNEEPKSLSFGNRDLRSILNDPKALTFFFACLRFKIDIARIDPSFVNMNYCRYLKKCQRSDFIGLFEIASTGWLSILFMGLLNSTRGYLFLFQHGPPAAAAFIAIMGYIPVIPYLVVVIFTYRCYLSASHLGVRARCNRLGVPLSTDGGITQLVLSDPRVTSRLLRDYVSWCGVEGRIFGHKVTVGELSPKEKELFEIEEPMDHHTFFISGSPRLTYLMLQAFMLQNVYYNSILLLTMVRDMNLPSFTWRDNIPLGLFAVVPTCFFLCTLPLVVQWVTIISASGSFLNTNDRRKVLTEIAQKDRMAKDRDGDAHGVSLRPSPETSPFYPFNIIFHKNVSPVQYVEHCENTPTAAMYTKARKSREQLDTAFRRHALEAEGRKNSAPVLRSESAFSNDVMASIRMLPSLASNGHSVQASVDSRFGSTSVGLTTYSPEAQNPLPKEPVQASSSIVDTSEVGASTVRSSAPPAPMPSASASCVTTTSAAQIRSILKKVRATKSLPAEAFATAVVADDTFPRLYSPPSSVLPPTSDAASMASREPLRDSPEPTTLPSSAATRPRGGMPWIVRLDE